MDGETIGDDELLHEVRDGVAFTTLNRPGARNALTFAMYEGLARLSATISEDPAVRAWVIIGAGEKAFAAGTDIAQFRAFRPGPEGAQDALDYETRVDRVLTSIENCAKPTVAAVAGACTGGGFAIATVCDLRIGAANARFGVPIARTLGNTLSMANHARFAALLGPARLTELVFTARLMEAEEAYRIGLLGEVLPDREALAARAEALARAVGGNAPLTLRATKIALRRLRLSGMAGAEGDDLVKLAFTSEDFREGMEAFLGKRPPRWQGR